MGVYKKTSVMGGPLTSTSIISNVNGFPKGNRALSADFMASMFDSIVSNGIVEGVGSELEISTYQGLQICVLSGAMWINGHMMSTNGATFFTLEPGHHYTIAVRLEPSAGDMSILVYADDDDGRMPYRNQTTYDMVLGYVDLSEFSRLTEITDDMLEDTRDDDELCGYAGLKLS